MIGTVSAMDRAWATPGGGQLPPLGASPYGALDMAGNVGEWVNDWYDANYYTSIPEPVINPQGPGPGPNGEGATDRVLVPRSLGGPDGVPLEYPPDYWNDVYGFRCARSD